MHIIVFVTVSNKKEAKKIARYLLKNRLVACINIVDKIESIFWWKGKVDDAPEALLIIKSKKEKLAKIISAVRSLHSYETPEIIALPIIDADKKYLKWIDDSLRKPY